MRRLFLAVMTIAAGLAAMSLAPNRAEAMTLPAPAIIADSVLGKGQVEAVRYVCRRVCGRYGCRRQCWRTRPRYYRPYVRPYRPYRPYRSYRYRRYY